MIDLNKALQQEITRKQFVISVLTAFGGLFGIASFLGLFTKSIDSHNSKNPGYGLQHYGP